MEQDTISLESCLLVDLQASQAEVAIIIKKRQSSGPFLDLISATQTLGKLGWGGWESPLNSSCFLAQYK